VRSRRAIHACPSKHQAASKRNQYRPRGARNRALALVDSEYCLFHDADDLLGEDDINTVLPLMDSSGVDVAAFRYSVLRTADEIPGGMPPVDKNMLEAPAASLLFSAFWHQWSW